MRNQPATKIPASPRLQTIVDGAVQQTLEKFASRKLEKRPVSGDAGGPDSAGAAGPGKLSRRGAGYPASVIKLFYLAAIHRWLEDGKINDTEELRRAMRDMIVDSLNEATGYLVDVLTDTTSGPELATGEMESWYFKRNAVNRYFAGLGYERINVNRKPWCEGPYGREIQSVRMHEPNHRNWLTTDATARLLTEIVLGHAVTSKRSAEMMELLKRDPFAPGDKNDQAHAYTGVALPQDSKLWSKAGWTSQTRHDAACVELPGGRKFVLVTFTLGHANEREIIPSIARLVIEGLQ